MCTQQPYALACSSARSKPCVWRCIPIGFPINVAVMTQLKNCMCMGFHMREVNVYIVMLLD